MECTEPISLEAKTSSNTALAVGEGVGYVDRVGAWDIEGASHRNTTGEKPLPGWRLFRVDKIFTYKPTMDKFNEPRPNYNPNGDKTMSKVILNAKFNT